MYCNKYLVFIVKVFHRSITVTPHSYNIYKYFKVFKMNIIVGE